MENKSVDRGNRSAPLAKDELDRTSEKETIAPQNAASRDCAGEEDQPPDDPHLLDNSDFWPSVSLAAVLLLIFSVVTYALLFSESGVHRVTWRHTVHPANRHLDSLRLLFPRQQEVLWTELGNIMSRRPAQGGLVLLSSGDARSTMLPFSRCLVFLMSGHDTFQAQRTIMHHMDPHNEHLDPSLLLLATLVVFMEFRSNMTAGVLLELYHPETVVTTTGFYPEQLEPLEKSRLLEFGMDVAKEILKTYNLSGWSLTSQVQQQRTVLLLEKEELHDGGLVC
ncbi:uncharacterized protein LOC114657107 [Erpetoichthys calabaricus]|uniref:uncharacterized protein LOC114657107 n=1 Tax=Erpetoichthys calabaricus TaxID=27687 RepID=UPI00109FC04D|nr:uncharacterized protein LOC114657107 [Erpetoichthys calabaricus]